MSSRSSDSLETHERAITSKSEKTHPTQKNNTMNTNAPRYLIHRSAAALAFLVLGPPALADNLISTLGQPANGLATITTNTARFFATDFLTAAQPASITQVTLRLRNIDIIPHTAIVELWSDGGNQPGSLFGAFDTSISIAANASSFANYTASDAGLLLAENTAYWLVVRGGEVAADSEFTADLGLTTGQDVNAGGVFSEIAATPLKVSNNSGSSWSDTGTLTPIYQLEGTAVPEPSTAALLLSTTAALTLGRFRRDKGTGIKDRSVVAIISNQRPAEPLLRARPGTRRRTSARR